ncbi:MAG: single-stranded DNA-binding protein [Anaerolineae bacterium]
MSYQKVIIVGNLGRDPEMRYTPDGTPVTSFSVATNRRWTNQDGSQGEETCWFRVSAWRRQAEVAAQYLSKGRQVMVEGRMAPDRATGGPRVWTGRDGTPGASYEITADRIIFLGGRGDTTAGPDEGEGPDYVAEDEIPF